MTRVTVSVTREGRTHYIGTIKGGNWWEHLVAHARLWLWNRRALRSHNG